MRKVLILLTTFGIVSAAYASNPPFLEKALEEYIKNGSEAFVIKLMKGSALDGDKNVAAQGPLLQQIETFYGKPESWEVVASCRFNNRYRRTYFIVYLTDGPLFGFVDSYLKSNDVEIAMKFMVNTEPEQILPIVPIHKASMCT